MNLQGVLIGLLSFIIIGIFHPIVIKSEYYFGKNIWPVFFLAGSVFIIISLFIQKLFVSSLFGVIGFCFLWSIKELRQQEERVKKGWFPKNPNR